MPKSKIRVENRIKAEAIRLGFSLCGITTTSPMKGFFVYENWLDSGFHSGMKYLASRHHRELRREPNLLVPEAKAILSLGWSYPLRMTNVDVFSPSQAWVAGYASGVDYHLWLIEKLERLSGYIRKVLGVSIEIHGFIDSAPILEREIAVRSGLGWIGKNSCLISPLVGSSVLLSELFVDFPLDPDQPFQNDRCGKCRRCLDACPTGCIQSDRTVDSSKCISYLTIEHKSMIPEVLRSRFGNWIFGCDICQMVCPWNHKNAANPRDIDLINWSLNQVVDLLCIKPVEFTNHFGESAISRAKYKGLMRNILIFLGNTADPSNAIHLHRFLELTTDDDLNETAQWALSQIENQQN